MVKQQKKYWNISGYDGFKKIAEYKISVAQITDKKLCELLRTLVVKYSNFSDEELIGCFAKKNTNAHRPFLEVHHDSRNNIYNCGVDISFAAKVE